MPQRTLLRASLALCAFAIVGCAPTAQSPSRVEVEASPRPPSPNGAEERREESIVITGSRIARQDRGASAGVTTAGTEELQMSGTLTSDQLLNETPSGRYAQAAPQPAPGSIDRDRYEHQVDNPVH